MKTKEGISSNRLFILNANAPVLSIKGSKVEETDRVLVKGTVISGAIKTRVIGSGKDKKPFKFIHIEDSKNSYLAPPAVNYFINDFSKIEKKRRTGSEVRDTAWGEVQGRKKKNNNFVVNYALPAAGAFIGYKLAQKQGAGAKKTALYVIGFGLLGMAPKYMKNNER